MGWRVGVWGLGAGLGLILAGAMATAQPAGQLDDSDRLNLPLEGTGTFADWVKAPDAAELVRLYPPLALILGIEGQAQISCTVETTGVLSGCMVVNESPTGLGFGDATVLAAGDFRMKPATRDGNPVKGNVKIPLHWQLAADQVVAFGAIVEQPPAPVSPEALALGRRVAADERPLQSAEMFLETLARDQVRKAVNGGAPAPEADKEALVFSLLKQNFAVIAPAYLDIQARKYAADMSVADLTQTASFLESPAGRAWAAEKRLVPSPSERKAYNQLALKARERARDELCHQLGCASTGGGKAGGGN